MIGSVARTLTPIRIAFIRILPTLSFFGALYDTMYRRVLLVRPSEELAIEALVLGGLAALTAVGLLFSIETRSDHPSPVYGAFAFASALFVVSIGDLTGLAIVVCLYSFVAGIRAGKICFAVCVQVAWVVVVAALSTARPIWEPLPPVDEFEIRYVLFSLGVVVPPLIEHEVTKRYVARLKRTNCSLESAVDELSAANMSYNTFVQMAESQAARHERSRITREIHDGVGYALTNLIMLAESAQDIARRDPKLLGDSLSTIRNQARVALSDTRRALRELRKAEQGLMHGQEAISHMMDVFEQATGVRADREFLIPHGTLENPRVFPVVYRLVQEALTNSFRHGHATVVHLRVWYVETKLVVSVTDNGQAPQEITEGIGLQGMRERLGEIGGELSYHSLMGFTVIAHIPFPASEVAYA